MSSLRHRHNDPDIEIDIESPPEEDRKSHAYRYQYGKLRRIRLLFPRRLWPPLLAAVILLFFLVFRSNSVPEAPQRKAKVEVPSNIKVSVVIMNHSRPRMIRESELLKTLTAHDAIDEILLCHSNPKTKFDYEHPKVKNIDAIAKNQKMGLSLRFHYCTTAHNPWVIHVDDDQELSSLAIDDMLSEFYQNSSRIVGRFGRGYNYWKAPYRHGYDTKTLTGPVEVVLTKLLIARRDLCEDFFHFQQVVEDLLPESNPLWNGEDIFMSLVANHVYKVPSNGPYNNLALPLDVWEASDSFKDDDTGAHDVSGNMDRHRIWTVGPINWWNAYVRAQKHARYRGRLWYTAKKRLAEMDEKQARRYI